jgi:hypothetical protein
LYALIGCGIIITLCICFCVAYKLTKNKKAIIKKVKKKKKKKLPYELDNKIKPSDKDLDSNIKRKGGKLHLDMD